MPKATDISLEEVDNRLELTFADLDERLEMIEEQQPRVEALLGRIVTLVEGLVEIEKER